MKVRRKERNAHTHAVKFALLAVLAFIVAVAVVMVSSTLNNVYEWTRNLPSVSQAANYAISTKTTVYANDKETVLAEFYLNEQQATTIDKVSKYVLSGTVATEDERFYQHNGIDVQGIVRAVVNNFTGGNLEGASTITQQLVRNTVLADEANDISLKRKIREADLALQMEKQYSKDEILMMYLNTINYGDGCYGIEAAAQHYYQKSAKDLTINEAATLIGIPQSPTYNNPRNYPDNCLKRRNVVLDRMLTYGAINQAEYNQAKGEAIELNLAPSKPADGIYKYPYFTSYVRETLVDSLSYEAVYSGGLTVYTTLDPKLQDYAEQAANETFATMEDDITMALTCVDPNNGYIVAMVGGRDYYTNQYNMATSESGRQAGSSFKAFTLTAAIEQGISPGVYLDCSSPTTINGWYVENDNNTSLGTRTLESATWVSSNTGYARLVTDDDGVKPQSVVDMAARLGVTGTSGFGAYPSITLGVSQVNTTKMAGAYATFAADGMHYETSCIMSVEDYDGRTLIDNTHPEGQQVISKEVSGAVTQVLKGVITRGTATDAALASGQESAGKTGTSENCRDAWFCAYTPQYSCSVWTGADPERDIGYGNWSRAAWKKFMTLALDGQETKKFNTYDAPEYKSTYNTKKGTGSITSGSSGSSSNNSNSYSYNNGYSYNYYNAGGYYDDTATGGNGVNGGTGGTSGAGTTDSSSTGGGGGGSSSTGGTGGTGGGTSTDPGGGGGGSSGTGGG